MPAWTRKDLPKLTDDLDRGRADLDRWGYCILAEAMPQDLVARARERLVEQAEAEKRLGYAFEDGGAKQQWGAFRDESGRIRPEAFRAENGGVNQRVWMLVNKGQAFLDVLELDRPHALIEHVLGEEYLISSYTANIAKPGGVPMNLHTDQWWAPQPTRPGRRNLPVGSITRTRFDTDPEAPEPPQAIAPSAVGNVIFMLNDFTEANGGTRLAPGSHLSGRHPDKERDAGVETVAAEGPAGAALVMDGRLWHGTGANVSNENRLGMLITYCGPQYRAQENYTLGTAPEVLEAASPRLKALLGFKVWWAYGRTANPTVDYVDPKEPLIRELRVQ